MDSRNRNRKFRGILSVEAVQDLSEQQLRWLRALGFLLPIAGAERLEGEGDGEGSGEGDGSGEGAGEGEGSGGGSGEGSGESSGESSGEGGGEGEGDDDRVPLTRSEYERLKRIARERDEERKKREQDEKKQKERLQREQGQYEELLREKDETISTAEAERDQARFELDQYKRDVRVNKVANRLGYKDPDDAARFLSDEDTEDEATTERALKRLAKQKPYLVEQRRSTGGPVHGDGVTLTLDQIKNMSQAEINARWDEVQKAMASG